MAETEIEATHRLKFKLILHMHMDVNIQLESRHTV